MAMKTTKLAPPNDNTNAVSFMMVKPPLEDIPTRGGAKKTETESSVVHQHLPRMGSRLDATDNERNSSHIHDYNNQYGSGAAPSSSSHHERFLLRGSLGKKGEGIRYHTATRRVSVSLSLSATPTISSPTVPITAATPSISANTTNTASSATLLSVHIKVETMAMVGGAMVALFGLALLCLAYSMGGTDVFRCCCKRRRGRRGGVGENAGCDDNSAPPPPSYDTVQEFVFDAENDTAMAIVDDVPTTMERLFPDLLSSSTDDLQAMGRRRRRRGQQSRPSSCPGSDDEGSGNGGAHSQLQEPLL